MKVRKPKSKRTPVRLRHKIEKASAAKQRKQRKQAKKDPTWRSKLKKDPGIPNLFPYKDKLLKEIEEKKARKEEEDQRRRDEAQARREGRMTGAEADAVMGDDADKEDEDDLLDLEDISDDGGNNSLEQDDASNPMAALLASAKARAKQYDHGNGVSDSAEEMEDTDDDNSSFDGLSPEPEETNNAGKSTPRHTQSKAYSKVISTSDVLLYILDARDPETTRSPSIETTITSDPSKRLLLILNKIDLIPPETLQAWLSHLRKSFPTFPLLSAGSTSANTFDHKHLTPQATATALLRALKTYASRQHLSRALSVGVLGYPNVGKSSVVNALASRLRKSSSKRKAGGRDKPCPVGAEAGITTALREVKLDGSVKLVDSPGVVFPSAPADAPTKRKSKREAEEEEHARLILLNAIPPHEITDPRPAVALLLRRLAASSSPELLEKLMQFYAVPPLPASSFEDRKSNGEGRDAVAEFLVHVARSRGRLGRGGVPNLHSAAMTVVADWREGRVMGWVDPPAADSDATKDQEKGGSAAANDEKKIVSQWAEEFKIEGLWGDDDEGNEQQAMDAVMEE